MNEMRGAKPPAPKSLNINHLQGTRRVFMHKKRAPEGALNTTTAISWAYEATAIDLFTALAKGSNTDCKEAER
jgi:hypothetical protein